MESRAVGGAVQQDEQSEQWLSHQTPDRAWVSPLKISTIRPGSGISDKETKPHSPVVILTPKTFCPLSLVSGWGANYLQTKKYCSRNAVSICDWTPSGVLGIGTHWEQGLPLQWGQSKPHPPAVRLYCVKETMEVKAGRSQRYKSCNSVPSPGK